MRAVVVRVRVTQTLTQDIPSFTSKRCPEPATRRVALRLPPAANLSGAVHLREMHDNLSERPGTDSLPQARVDWR